jgi:hypothetical protein
MHAGPLLSELCVACVRHAASRVVSVLKVFEESESPIEGRPDRPDMSGDLRKCQHLEGVGLPGLACGALPALGFAWVPRPRIQSSQCYLPRLC